jgi:hypothetical protein
VEQVGKPGGAQLQLPSMLSLRQAAEASGCLVSGLVIKCLGLKWAGAAGWLARVWEAEGRPRVEAGDWEIAAKNVDGFEFLDVE